MINYTIKEQEQKADFNSVFRPFSNRANWVLVTLDERKRYQDSHFRSHPSHNNSNQRFVVYSWKQITPQQGKVFT